MKGDHAEIDGTPKELIEIIEHFMKLGQMTMPKEVTLKEGRNPIVS